MVIFGENVIVMEIYSKLIQKNNFFYEGDKHMIFTYSEFVQLK